jgi:cytochrome c-type biogenesis protein CcmH/NrfG
MQVLVQICVLIATLAAPLWASDLEGARQLYQHAAYEAAWRALQGEDSQDARVLLLAGQIQYQLGNYKEASDQLGKASQLEPERAEIFLWLGRSLGRRAETANILSAPGYAVRCREALERAVALDVYNISAMNDLLTYYLQAPGFLGGGIEKAERLAAKIAGLDAAEGQSVAARMAEKRQDFSAAEAHLQRAVELEPRQVERLIELAQFFARQGAVIQSEQSFAQAAEMMPAAPKLLFARAELYIRQQRYIAEAHTLLRRYLQMPLTPEDPPRREAERLLAKTGG